GEGRAAAFVAGRSDASRRALRSRAATPVRALGRAAPTGDRPGGDGPQAGGPHVLDVAQGMGLPAGFAVRFARGATRGKPWCEVDHRTSDWGPRSPHREFEFVIMIDVGTE